MHIIKSSRMSRKLYHVPVVSWVAGFAFFSAGLFLFFGILSRGRLVFECARPQGSEHSGYCARYQVPLWGGRVEERRVSLESIRGVHISRRASNDQSGQEIVLVTTNGEISFGSCYGITVSGCWSSRYTGDTRTRAIAESIETFVNDESVPFVRETNAGVLTALVTILFSLPFILVGYIAIREKEIVILDIDGKHKVIALRRLHLFKRNVSYFKPQEVLSFYSVQENPSSGEKPTWGVDMEWSFDSKSGRTPVLGGLSEGRCKRLLKELRAGLEDCQAIDELQAPVDDGRRNAYR